MRLHVPHIDALDAICAVIFCFAASVTLTALVRAVMGL